MPGARVEDSSGRSKSCRRVTSELFLKEEEQPPLLPEMTPMTPLRWRSSSMMQLQGSEDRNSSEQQSQLQNDPGQSSQGESPAGPVDQMVDRESTHRVRDAKHSSCPSLEGVPSPGQSENGRSESVTEAEQAISGTEAIAPPTLMVEAVSPGELKRSAETGTTEHAGNASISVTNAKVLIETPAVAQEVPVEEIVEFQPVDLDQKYRQKELIRHVTAAKIQNREESILNNPSLPALEARKAPAGGEPAAMTIEFLRARLLAERSATKATKQQMSQLSKKVVDLEGRLATEVELRKKAEAALQDALAKLNPLCVSGEEVKKKAFALSTCGLEKAKCVQLKASDGAAGDVRLGEVLSSDRNKAVSRRGLGLQSTSSSGEVLSSEEESSGLSGESNESSMTQVDSAAEGLGQGSLQRSSGSENGSKSSESSHCGSSPDKDAASCSHLETRENTRTAIEERLRTMWRQIGQEMAALSEVKEGDSVRQELMGWMEQVPKVLQEKRSESGTCVGGAKLGVILPNGSLTSTAQEITEKGSKIGNVANEAPVTAERSGSVKKNASFGKKMGSMVEQFEAEENVQRVWEENFEAQKTVAHREDELPPLVTADGNVIPENESPLEAGTMPGPKLEKQTSEPLPSPPLKSGSPDSTSQTEGNLSKSKSLDSSIKPAFSASATKSFEMSHDTSSLNTSKRASFNGRIEIIDDQPPNDALSDELLDDEDAEELPNGIYIHHSKDEDDSYRSAPKYGTGPERVPANRGFHSPGSTSDRRPYTNGYDSSGSRSDRGPQVRERFPPLGASGGSIGEGDAQGWPVREVKERASRDVYYAPAVNSRNVRAEAGPFTQSEREYLHRLSTERSQDDSLYRNGPGQRWDPHMADPTSVQRQEERRMSDPNFSRSSSEDGSGCPYPPTERDVRNPYFYPDRDHLDHDRDYRNSYRPRGEGPRGDVYRSVPPWQEGENSGWRGRSMGPGPYAYPSMYSVEEPQPPQHIETVAYNNHGRSEMYHPPHRVPSRPDLHPQHGMPGPRTSMNGFTSRPDTPSATNHGHTGWNTGSPLRERSAAVVPTDDVSGDTGAILQALRIAKQQIKSSTVEQASYMTAQYTVSSEHRYGSGGQVSKTSYTVEAPVGYPRVTRTVHEGWHLEGKPKRVGIDVNGPQATDLITTAGSMTARNGETSYIEKLNVGRGIQFFFP